MKITKEKPEIVRIIYRQERGDPDYGSCLWAIFDFDAGRGLLNIQSDCGDYAYRWPERGNNFLRLFRTMDEGYLLGKLCGRPGRFDKEGTIGRITEWLDEMEISDAEKESAIRDLQSCLEKCSDGCEPELAMTVVDEWNDDEDLGIDCAWELVRKRYTADQIRIVKVFREYIIPEIRKELEERENE